MKTKKSTKANLEQYSKLFIQLGLVLSLFIAFLFLELKTEGKKVVILKDYGIVVTKVEPDVVFRKPEVKITPKIKFVEPTELKKIDNDDDIKEAIFKSTEDTPDEPFDPNTLIELPVDPPVVDEVDFIAVQFAPTFLNCKGTEKEKRACFEKTIRKHVAKKFNPDIATEVGLSSGKKRIFVLFKIDKNGAIVDVIAKAPHKRLEKEAIKIVKSLPKLIPGKQGTQAVGVKYTLPITFNVE